MADDDLRRSSAAAAREMSVYVWSAFLAGTRFRAKIAPWVARFGRGLPGQHGVHARGFAGCVECRGASYGAPQAAPWNRGQLRDARFYRANFSLLPARGVPGLRAMAFGALGGSRYQPNQ